jgi:hypothetical protein
MKDGVNGVACGGGCTVPHAAGPTAYVLCGGGYADGRMGVGALRAPSAAGLLSPLVSRTGFREGSIPLLIISCSLTWRRFRRW